MWYFHQVDWNQMPLLPEATEVKTTQQKKEAENNERERVRELTILIIA